WGPAREERGGVSNFSATHYEQTSDAAASAATPKSASQTKAPARPNQPAATPGNILGAAPTTTNRPIAKAQISPSPNSATNPATGSANGALRSAPNPANNLDLSASVGEAPASAPPSGFVRLRDPKNCS